MLGPEATEKQLRAARLAAAYEEVAERLGLSVDEVKRLNQFMPVRGDSTESVLHFITNGHASEPLAEVPPMADRLERKILVASFLESLTTSPRLFGPNPKTDRRVVSLRARGRRGVPAVLAQFTKNTHLAQDMATSLARTAMEMDDLDDDAFLTKAQTHFGVDELRATLMLKAYKQIRRDIVQAILAESTQGTYERPVEDIQVQKLYLKMLFPSGFSKALRGNVGAEYIVQGGFLGGGTDELVLSYAYHMSRDLASAYRQERTQQLLTGAEESAEAALERVFNESFVDLLFRAEAEVGTDRQFSIASFRGQYHASRLTDTLSDLRRFVPTLERAGVIRFSGTRGQEEASELDQIYKQTIDDEKVQWVLPIAGAQIWDLPANLTPERLRAARDDALRGLIRRQIISEVKDAFGYRLPEGVEVPHQLMIPIRVNHANHHWTGMNIIINLDDEARAFFAENAGALIENRDAGVPDRTAEILGALRNGNITIEHYESNGGGYNPAPSRKKKKKKGQTGESTGAMTVYEYNIYRAVSLAQGNDFTNLNLTFVQVVPQAGSTCLDHSMWNIFLHSICVPPVPMIDSDSIRLITDTVDPVERLDLATQMLRRMNIAPEDLEEEHSVTIEPDVTPASEHSAPSAEIAPVAEQPAPSADRIVPASKHSAPSAERPAPAVEQPAPSADRIVPVSEHSAPSAEIAPVAEQPAPSADRIVPVSEDSAPSAEIAPVAEQLAPSADRIVPASEHSAPNAEIAPVAEQPAPSADRIVPASEHSAPSAERPALVGEQPAPLSGDREDGAGEPSEPSEPSSHHSSVSNRRRPKFWRPSQIRLAITKGIDKYRKESQWFSGSAAANVLWGILTFCLMVFTLFIVRGPFMSHLRANQLQDFAATNNIKTRESLVRRWGRVGRSKDEVALNKDDDQLLEACLDEGNRQLFSLRSLEDVAIKALPAAKDSDDSVAHYRGRGLARVT